MIPCAVAEEIRVGRERGVRLPNESEMSNIETIQANPSVFPARYKNLGRGELEVLSLAMLRPNSLVVNR